MSYLRNIVGTISILFHINVYLDLASAICCCCRFIIDNVFPCDSPLVKLCVISSNFNFSCAVSYTIQSRSIHKGRCPITPEARQPVSPGIG